MLAIPKHVRESNADQKLTDRANEKNLKREKLIKKTVDFLTEIYLELADGPKQIKLSSKLREWDLHTWYSKFMQDLNIISAKGLNRQNLFYSWTDKNIEPDEDMAVRLINAYYKGHDGLREKQRLANNNKQLTTASLKSLKVIPLDKEKLKADLLSEKETDRIAKIRQFLDHAYPLTHKVSAPIPAERLKFKTVLVNSGLSGVTLTKIIELGYLKRHGERLSSAYTWSGEKPSDDMAHQVLVAERDFYKLQGKKYYNTTEKKEKKQKPVIALEDLLVPERASIDLTAMLDVQTVVVKKIKKILDFAYSKLKNKKKPSYIAIREKYFNLGLRGSIMDALLKCNIISREGSTVNRKYLWIDNELPSMEMAFQVYNVYKQLKKIAKYEKQNKSIPLAEEQQPNTNIAVVEKPETIIPPAPADVPATDAEITMALAAKLIELNNHGLALNVLNKLK